MIPVEDAETLRAEAEALRAEVREVVAILENWTQTADRNHAGGRVRAPPGGIRPDDGPARGAGVDESMQQIVNGLNYDTEKADLVASDRWWDGHNFERNGRNTYLYRTKAGRFFLHHTTLWQGERDRIEPMSPDE
ncbi:MAG: hypothetical protein RJR34_13230 [Candidatus Methanoculleus thermohydrogenotrophicum]|nr:hypothetical protein [Candidatus Methanoculleus thermohydrogenotrophicum]